MKLTVASDVCLGAVMQKLIEYLQNKTLGAQMENEYRAQLVRLRDALNEVLR